jgi:hypothetical protein
MILKLQKTKNALIIPVFIFLQACSGGNDKNHEEPGYSLQEINLIDNVKNIAEAFNLSDISGSIELMQLEMIPDFLFNEDNINNLIVTDEFISFYSPNAGLLKYSRDGKFLGRIGILVVVPENTSYLLITITTKLKILLQVIPIGHVNCSFITVMVSF